MSLWHVLGVLLEGEAFAGRAGAEAVVGEGEGDDVEGWGCRGGGT